MVVIPHQAQGWISEFGQVQGGIVLTQRSFIRINILWINVFNGHFHIFLPTEVLLFLGSLFYRGSLFFRHFILNNKGFFLDFFLNKRCFIGRYAYILFLSREKGILTCPDPVQEGG